MTSSRLARLVLVDAHGTPLGVLPPYPVPVPWWQESADVVDGARVHFGLDVTILRILSADRPKMPGGTVTYLAECATATAPAGAGPLADAGIDPRTVTDPQPHRRAYAEPGGPERSLAWARAQLGRPDATAHQHRTWNLSAIWRLDAGAERAWLKQVPPFFRHEAAVLRWLEHAAPGRAPRLLAAGDEGRLLLAHVPGEDWYEADVAGRHRVGVIAHGIQRAARGDLDALVAAGVPDRRGRRLAEWIRATLAPHTPSVDEVLPDLDERIAAAAGLPDTLVHGDLHPGNTRVTPGGDAVVIDWGDSFAGNPVFDILRLSETVDGEGLRAAWAARWREAVPGCDPEGAIEALRPVAALRSAAVYAEFLANIEPAEHPYHAADVPRCLQEAREAAGRPTVGA
ncbi:aminoglycoside phosphotransferase family protein [Asanoa sp. WMMD1127]|uniref:aminoglycoside phosphotransferase family protein n=1 Tax=Asanoa sp. WMMD1127 TaxID=3016107 RepID=UPI002417CD87|nr:aminoglycoside phosphotransferase family protein [Asanoa sp. WMMD1127]MDG4824296.1 aminoglycoside phosphotransferase family protein [Asanoa sp. WMMD1127]